MIEQGSAEWLKLRCGKVTASRVADVIAKTKTGWGAMRANYLAELVAERLTGNPAVGYTNDAMRWGTETEPQARAGYEFFKDTVVELAGFVDHPEIEHCGASPDGYIGADGLLEVKCPSTATHIETLLSGAMPERYVTQMQFQMACTGRLWCDFVSFDPRMPGHMQLFVKRLERNDKHIAVLEYEVRAFLAELNEKVLTLVGRYAA